MKVILFGKSRAGKTQLFRVLNHMEYDPQYQETSLFDWSKSKGLNRTNSNVTRDLHELLFLDCTGRVSMREHLQPVLKYAHLGLYCLDLSEDLDFDTIDRDLRQFHEDARTAVLIRVGTKSDIAKGGNLEKFKQLYHYYPQFRHFIITSASTGEGINDLYHLLTDPQKQILPWEEAMMKLLNDSPKRHRPRMEKKINQLWQKLNSTSDYEQRGALLEKFVSDNLSYLNRHAQIRPLFYTFVCTMIVTIVTAALGFAAGFVSGLWLGPAAFLTAFAAGSLAAINVVVASTVLGASSGFFSYSMFQTREKNAKIPQAKVLLTDFKQEISKTVEISEFQRDELIGPRISTKIQRCFT